MPPGLPVPRQLPADAGSFVAREDEMRQLVPVLRAGSGAPSASVITGTAGAGKTAALAVQAAHALAGDFPDGQLHADLRGFDASPAVPPHDVLGRFLAALGIPPDRIRGGADERAALYRSPAPASGLSCRGRTPR